jgi:hypothetical protein
LNGLIFAIACPNSHSPPIFQEETHKRILFWGMFAAEVRYRAADDLSFLLPADGTVKRLAGIGNPGIRDRETGVKDRESGVQERRHA